MEKTPQFPFYYRDWLHAVRYWTADQKILYLEMLCDQADSETGSVPPDVFNNVCKDDYVRGKFAEDDNGFFNERMRNILKKRESHSQKQRENIQKRYQSSTKTLPNDYQRDTKGIPLDNDNDNSIVVVNRKGNCLLKNSGVELKDVKNNFFLTQDLHLADPGYYFNTALDWSDSKGEMRKDWLATIRNFARRDMKDGKMKISNNQQSGGSNLSKEKFTPSPVTGKEITREEYLRRKEAGHA